MRDIFIIMCVALMLPGCGSLPEGWFHPQRFEDHSNRRLPDENAQILNQRQHTTQPAQKSSGYSFFGFGGGQQQKKQQQQDNYSSNSTNYEIFQYDSIEQGDYGSPENYSFYDIAEEISFADTTSAATVSNPSNALEIADKFADDIQNSTAFDVIEGQQGQTIASVAYLNVNNVKETSTTLGTTTVSRKFAKASPSQFASVLSALALNSDIII